jgi:hypothetical protein
MAGAVALRASARATASIRFGAARRWVHALEMRWVGAAQQAI